MKRDTQAQERDTHLQGVDFADVRSLIHENGGPDRIRTYDLPLRRRGNFQQNQRLAGPTPDLISTVSATVTARALALVTDPERAAQAPLIARQRAWARLKEAREQREDAA